MYFLLLCWQIVFYVCDEMVAEVEKVCLTLLWQHNCNEAAILHKMSRSIEIELYLLEKLTPVLFNV